MGETVAFLLHREERISQLKLWLHTLLVFLGITAVLFLPFGVSLARFLSLPRRESLLELFRSST